MFVVVSYILLSCIEGIAFLFLTFGLFRIKIREYLKEIVMSILVVSVGTYLLSDNPAISQFIPLINIIALIVFLVCFFKVLIPHTFLITISGYITCMIIQWGIIQVADIVGGIDLTDIKNSEFLKAFFQLLSSAIIITISSFLRRYKLWFTFVPYSTSLNFRMTKSNLTLLIATTIILFIFGSTLKYSALIFGFSIWIICFITLFTVSIRREFQN